MKTSALDRVFNTIRRAVDELGMAIDTNDALIDIFAEAENDYVLAERLIDSDGNVVAVVSK